MERIETQYFKTQKLIAETYKNQNELAKEIHNLEKEKISVENKLTELKTAEKNLIKFNEEYKHISDNVILIEREIKENNEEISAFEKEIKLNNYKLSWQRLPRSKSSFSKSEELYKRRRKIFG